MAEITLERLRTTDKEKYPANTLTDYYDTIHKLMEAIALLSGIKTKGEGSHQELIDYVAKKDKEDLTVMTDLKLTPQELQDLKLGEQVAGLYCQQCGQCVSGCPKSLPIPDLMRSYMYAYGYRNLQAAHELVGSLDVAENPCGSCASYSAVCAKGFDIADRVKDISRLRAVPGDFFA
jgi:ferredoxin